MTANEILDMLRGTLHTTGIYNFEWNIVIMKDNWTWIIGTLILRYIGVFVVLLVLLVGMTISGAIISRSVKKMEARS